MHRLLKTTAIALSVSAVLIAQASAEQVLPASAGSTASTKASTTQSAADAAAMSTDSASAEDDTTSKPADVSQTEQSSTAPAKAVEETASETSIKDLNIPQDSMDIYVIKPPPASRKVTTTTTAPVKEDTLPKPAETKPSLTKPGQTPDKAHAKRHTTPPMLMWNPDGKPTCVLLCVHGLGLYNHSYEDFGKRVAKLGIAVCAIDVRGFGSWAEAQGHEKVDFDGCLADIQATLKVLHRVYPGLPVFIVGESMGGAIALRATALYPDLVSGLISSVPAADRFQQKRTALKVAAHLLASPDKPFDVGTGIINQATVDPALKQAWLSDPLDRLNVSANELLQFQAFMNQNHESAKLITDKPVLIVQGCKDHLVRPEGTVELYNELGTPDRELILIPKSEHLIFEESQCTDQVLQTVVGWINSHLPANSLTK
jgi:alpha-beta hydrolase superfamily lysophospholipase